MYGDAQYKTMHGGLRGQDDYLREVEVTFFLNYGVITLLNGICCGL